MIHRLLRRRRRATIQPILLPGSRQWSWLPSLLRLVAISVLVAGAARAGEAPALLEGRMRLEVSYSAAVRSSFQAGGPASIRFLGVSPHFARVSAAHFLFPWLGLAGDLSLDTFGVTGPGFGSDVNLQLQAGQLTLAALGRWQPLPPLSLEGQLGYVAGFLPTLIVSSDQVEASAVQLGGPHLALGARYQLFSPLDVHLGVRGMPLGLGVQTPLPPGGGRAWQFSISAGASWTILAAGPALLAVGLDYEFQQAQARNAGGYDLQQSAHRLGLALRAWLPERSATQAPGLDRPLPGRLRGLVVGNGSRPIPGAQVALAGREPLVTSADGSFALEDLPPGSLEVTVTAAGFKARAESVTIAAGEELKLTVTLAAPSGPGRIRGLAFAGPGRQPLASVTVEGPSGTITSAADGSFVLEGVGPGPVALKASARGYQAAEEVVSVPPEGEAAVELTLNKETARILASMRGQVRTVRGKPVAALLKIPEAQINTRTASDGRFHVRVPGGKYTVVFEAKGFVRQSKVVEVSDGDQAIFYVDLSREDR